MSDANGDTVSLLGMGDNVRTRRHSMGTANKRRRKLSRRAHLIGLCGVGSLCVLLIIATTQHNPLMSSSTSTLGKNNNHHNNNNIDNQATGTMNDVSSLYSSMVVYNLTATIDDVLAEQRARLTLEMQADEYPTGRYDVMTRDTETLDIPVRSLIVTTWRSGSTFLGDILNAMPGNYYHYEPLLDFGINRLRERESAISAAALRNLMNLLHCNYTQMRGYLNYGKEHTYLFEHNIRLWNICKEFPQYCWNAKFLTQFCQLFPRQSMKTVRLSLGLAEYLLMDKSLNVRIVLLVRDPRGTMQSRKHRTWCGGNPDCEDPRLLCNDLVDDFRVAQSLLTKYPQHFRTLRYEDLSLNPYEVTQDILQFYGLPFDPMVEEFLNTHTKVNIGGVSSTYRDSKSAPFHWKMDLQVSEIRFIERQCSEAMKLWGYRQIDNYTNFQNTFDPIILPPPFA